MHDSIPELNTSVACRIRVPSGARGGLGNIKAKDHSKQQPSAPPSYRFNLIGSLVKSSFSSPSGSASSRSGSSSSRSCSSSSAMAPGNSSLSVDTRATRDWLSTYPSPVDERNECTSASATEPSSPVRPPSIQTMHTFGSAITPGALASVGSEYKAHLSEDARHRADRKRSQLAREKERREMTGKKGEDNDMFMRIRTGRGGAAVIVRADGSRIDSNSHPVTADITQMKEAQMRALEQSLFAASRARAIAAGSTGRGGSGNIGSASQKKTINTRKLAKMERAAVKGKGKATESISLTDETGLGETNSHTDAASPDYSSVGNFRPETAINQHGSKKGIGRIWRRMARSGREGEKDGCRNSDVAGHLENAEDDQLDLRTRQTAQSVGAPAATPPGISEKRCRRPGSAGNRRRNASRQDGVEHLVFVNAELRNMGSSRSARNVLGVAGTPGFPSDGHQSETNPSTFQSAVPFSSLPLVQSDEEWSNDDGTPVEEEDSDIDPSFSLGSIVNHGAPNSGVVPISINGRDSSSSGLTAVSTDTFGQVAKVVLNDFDSKFGLAPKDEDRKLPAIRAKTTPFPLPTQRTRGMRQSSRIAPQYYHLASGNGRYQSMAPPPLMKSLPRNVGSHRLSISASTYGNVALAHQPPPPTFPIPRTPEMVT